MAAPMSGPGTPYITPAVLRRAPTGIDWTSIPNSRSSTPEQVAEQTNICLRSTGMVDAACNQVLRATLDTELFTGPDWKVTIQNSTGVGRVMCSRWPILQAVSVQVAPAWSFPRNWQTIAANLVSIEKPALGVYGSSAPADSADGGQALLLAPGVIDWWNSRNGWRLQIQYISGWPHTSLTSAINSGATSLPVDDITGWAPPPANADNPAAGQFGAVGIVYDGLQQEVVTAAGVTPNTAGALSGPGTIQIATATLFPHGTQTLVTTMPQTVINAAIDFASSQALERGANATVIQSVSGGGGDTGGPVTASQLRTWAIEACLPFARVW